MYYPNRITLARANGNYKGKMLLIPRSKCYFHEKAIHAWRAGALAVVISNSRADGKLHFEMELPQTQGLNNTGASNSPTRDD